MTACTQGVHHIGLTVPDIQKTLAFFECTMGFKVVGAKSEYPAVFVSDGSIMITLWQAKEPDTATPFDRHHNIGLHHLALNIPSASALESLAQELEAHDDVIIEFAPEAMGSSGLTHMMCTIPGGIRLELITA